MACPNQGGSDDVRGTSIYVTFANTFEDASGLLFKCIAHGEERWRGYMMWVDRRLRN